MGFKGRSNLHAGVNQDSLLFVLLKVLAHTLFPLILTNEVFKTSTIKLIFYIRIWSLERLSEKLKPVSVDLNTRGPLVVSWVSLPPSRAELWSRISPTIVKSVLYFCEITALLVLEDLGTPSWTPPPTLWIINMLIWMIKGHLIKSRWIQVPILILPLASYVLAIVPSSIKIQIMIVLIFQGCY